MRRVRVTMRVCILRKDRRASGIKEEMTGQLKIAEKEESDAENRRKQFAAPARASRSGRGEVKIATTR
jgi:hypothetical protein